MPNYSQGKIYKIVSEETDKVYIGSTTKKYLCERMADHNSSYHRLINGTGKKQCSSYEIIKHGDAKIILLEKYPCEDKDELKAREQYWIDKNKSVNAIKAFIGKGEDKIKYVKEQAKENYSKNKNHKLEYQSQYYQENKEKCLDWHKQNREKNGDKIKAKKSKKEMCKCGMEYSHSNYARHSKTKKHRSYQEENAKDV